MMSLTENIIVDATDMKFCVGPCNSKEEETTEKKFLKPYSGGKYKEFWYPVGEECNLILKNVRICNSCNHRFHEFLEENEIDSLKGEAQTILKKLEI